jgi:hypothetical protein
MGRVTEQCWKPATSVLVAAVMAGGAFDAVGQEEALPEQVVVPEAVNDMTGENVSGTVGADLYSHFVSYGFDVWGAGDDYFDGEETFNPYADVTIDFDAFSVTAGLWGDVNDNAESGIGGDLQEVDLFAGIDFAVGDRFAVGLYYQEWIYGSQTEDIFDINLAFDDSDLIAEDFALNPGAVIHNRVSGDGLEEGTVIVVGVEPSFTVLESEEMTLDISVPIAVGYVLDEEYFTAGGDDGLGYISIGAAASVPLPIPTEYGEWAVNGGISYYMTEDDVYANPEEDFFVFNVGVSMAF